MQSNSFQVAGKFMGPPIAPCEMLVKSYFREIKFVNNPIVRANYWSKAQGFARKLVRKQKERADEEQIVFNTVEIDEFDDDEDDMMISSSNRARSVGGKKQPFDVFMCADSVPKQNRIIEEVSKYNRVPLDSIARRSKEFLEDVFSVVRHWYEQRTQFSNLYGIVVRIFATPVSSCASERVFCTLKLFVNEKAVPLKYIINR